jgi:hypothetical protein
MHLLYTNINSLGYLSCFKLNRRFGYRLAKYSCPEHFGCKKVASAAILSLK